MADMVTVYRVELPDGTGPYNGLGRYSTLHSTCDYEPLAHHPRPVNDGMGDWLNWRGSRFGFATVEQFNAWFNDGSRAALAAEGYQLSIYNVSSEYLARGGRQVAFAKDKATLARVETLA